MNRISEFREAAGLTQRALGAQLATSPQQVARYEAGHQISPAMALRIARVFDKPLNAIFPDVGEDVPKNNREWLRLGFDLEPPLPTWHVHVQVRGADETLSYLVDSADCARLDGLLSPQCASGFITFTSCGRSIYLNTQAIEWISIIKDGAILAPEFECQIGDLEPEYGSMQFYFIGQTAPLFVECLETTAQDLQSAFVALHSGGDVSNQCLRVRDDSDDLVYVRVSELALAEIPTLELLEEMKPLTV